MKNALNSVKVAAPSTSTFDLSHDVKLSCQMGDLVPVLAMECLPGDRVKIGCEHLSRLAPMLAPLMHRVDVRVEYFFVPNRLVWENWENWITNGGADPATDVLPVHPFLYINGTGLGGGQNWNSSRLFDFMGIPDPGQCPDGTYNEKISAIPFAAYQRIYDEFYRDENVIDTQPTAIECIDGNNTLRYEMFKIRKRAWEADYFTKALPWAQKGQSVDVPLGEVELKNNWWLDGTPHHQIAGGSYPASLPQNLRENYDTTNFIEVANNVAGIGGKLAYDPDGSLTVGATTINDLRLAYRLQEWLERNARGGTRYAELIRAHYNVSPQDARLQRPEYIVGVKNPIQISEVLNTTGTVDAPQGTMTGHGISYYNGSWGKYFCQEHGYIIGLLSVMPKTCYQQGIPRHFLKIDDPTQIAWPTFANLGEQEVLNREIMAFRTTGGETWGYQSRYMEYKNLPNRVCGDFRDTLNFWHMGRIFDSSTPPQLNQDFIECNPTYRIWAVEDTSYDHCWMQVLHHIHVNRALPFYGTPTF